METLNVYWANVCILNRREREKLEDARAKWNDRGGLAPQMIFLGDTEEIQMYERLDLDAAKGELAFDIIVSTRFDVFLSRKYLLGRKEALLPIRGLTPVSQEIEKAGILDPWGLFQPLAVLPHVIVRDSGAEGESPETASLESLLDPYWSGKVCIGTPDLPSGKVVLFAMWYKFGDAGLESCVKNWRKKSAPSAARHGVLKKEYPLAVLPGVFSGPGPEDKVRWTWPAEGAPVLPSYCAVRQGPRGNRSAEFLRDYICGPDFQTFYRDQAFAYPAVSGIPAPEPYKNLETTNFLFPDWNWIESRDMDYFQDACSRMRAD